MSASPSGRIHIRKVAVCGAGVMGAQIAAHCVNAGIPAVLFDLPVPDGEKNGLAKKAIAQLTKANPAPLGVPELARFITPANYDDNLDLLGQCDLVSEAIAERMDWKQQLYDKIAPGLSPHAILATHTSGLPIPQLSQALPENLRTR